MVYSDSHAHLADYSVQQVSKIVDLMRHKQVVVALAVSVDLNSSQQSIDLAGSFNEIKAGAGIHPWFASPLSGKMKERFQDMAASPYVKSIGEIGLDYDPPRPGVKAPNMPKIKFPENMPPLPEKPPSRENQKELFSFELTLAKKLGKPVNVHCRGGAHADMMEILRRQEFKGVQGITHSFDYDLKTLRDWLDVGFYITLGAMPLMMESNSTIDDFVKSVPLEKMVVETDANPMLNPENGPVDVIPVVQKIASIRGVTAEEIGNATTANLKRVLKI